MLDLLHHSASFWPEFPVPVASFCCCVSLFDQWPSSIFSYLYCFFFNYFFSYFGDPVSRSSGWPLISYIVKDDFELLILVPPHPECWDHRCVPSRCICLACVVWRNKPRAFCLLGKPSTKGTPPPSHHPSGAINSASAQVWWPYANMFPRPWG